jgi:heme oxygenase (biliverdin-IX-beta and delta-forming)
VGLLYVLEGSSLGARLIARQASRLGFDESFGARHLALQARSLENWRIFLGLLEAVEPLDMSRAVNAAILTFRSAALAFGTSMP